MFGAVADLARLPPWAQVCRLPPPPPRMPTLTHLDDPVPHMTALRTPKIPEVSQGLLNWTCGGEEESTELEHWKVGGAEAGTSLGKSIVGKEHHGACCCKGLGLAIFTVILPKYGYLYFKSILLCVMGTKKTILIWGVMNYRL